MGVSSPVQRAMLVPRRLAAGAAIVTLSMSIPGVAHAATIPVACGGPGGGGAGLVAAVAAANSTPGPDTISLASGCTYLLTAAASPDNGLPVVTGDLMVLGHGATIERSSASLFRILEVAPGATVALDAVTIAGGALAFSGPLAIGGGILNGGTLTVTRSTIRDNQVSGSGSSAGGGGIANNGTATITDTVLRANRATATGTRIFSAVGGALLNRTDATMSIDRSTVVGNAAASKGASEILFIAAGGGIGSTGTLRVHNTRIAENRTAADGPGGQSSGGGMSIAFGLVLSATLDEHGRGCRRR